MGVQAERQRRESSIWKKLAELVRPLCKGDSSRCCAAPSPALIFSLAFLWPPSCTLLPSSTFSAPCPGRVGAR